LTELRNEPEEATTMHEDGNSTVNAITKSR